MVELYSGDNRISPKGLEILSKGNWDKLEKLNLGMNNIDKGIKFLYSFSELRILCIWKS